MRLTGKLGVAMRIGEYPTLRMNLLEKAQNPTQGSAMVKRVEKPPVPKYESPREKDVREELEALDRAYKKISKNKASAIAFLHKAGILTKTGKLTKKYR
jgi:hypothetical protein